MRHGAQNPGAVIWTWIESPLGPMLAMSDGDALSGLHFHDDKYVPHIASEWQRDDRLPLFRQTGIEVAEYFAGQRRRFDLPLAPEGTDWQQRVWQVLVTIPFGETTTYGAMAATLGNRNASRAVGAANGRNPIAVVIPCHRAIGADGSLTGYAGGLGRKQALLELEGVVPGEDSQGNLAWSAP